ncbi:MAG: hypothetical protein R2769_11965 [Saprospiraceae bacterium]
MANKVLLVVDGVRLNNIIYRAGHLQDAIKVDNNILEQERYFMVPVPSITARMPWVV